MNTCPLHKLLSVLQLVLLSLGALVFTSSCNHYVSDRLSDTRWQLAAIGGQEVHPGQEYCLPTLYFSKQYLPGNGSKRFAATITSFGATKLAVSFRNSESSTTLPDSFLFVLNDFYYFPLWGENDTHRNLQVNYLNHMLALKFNQVNRGRFDSGTLKLFEGLSSTPSLVFKEIRN